MRLAGMVVRSEAEPTVQPFSQHQLHYLMAPQTEERLGSGDAVVTTGVWGSFLGGSAFGDMVLSGIVVYNHNRSFSL